MDDSLIVALTAQIEVARRVIDREFGPDFASDNLAFLGTCILAVAITAQSDTVRCGFEDVCDAIENQQTGDLHDISLTLENIADRLDEIGDGIIGCAENIAKHD